MGKVNIMTCNDVEFGGLRWWSRWIDICVFEHDLVVHLVQMKISRLNKKKFRTVKVTPALKSARLINVGDLTQMKGENNE